MSQEELPQEDEATERGRGMDSDVKVLSAMIRLFEQLSGGSRVWFAAYLNSRYGKTS